MSKRKFDESEDVDISLPPRKEAKIEESPYKFDVYLNGNAYNKFKSVMQDGDTLKECVDKIIDQINKNQPDTVPKSKYSLEIKSVDGFVIDTDQQIGKISKVQEIFKIYISFSKLVILKVHVDGTYKKTMNFNIPDNQKFENLLPLIKENLISSKMWIKGTDLDLNACTFSMPMKNDAKIIPRDNSFNSIKNGEEINVHITTKITSYFSYYF